MTKSIAIVNLSNWDGENYEVVTENGDKYILEPGEYCIPVHGGDLNVEIVDAERESPKSTPFYVGMDHGEYNAQTGAYESEPDELHQTFPVMHVEWENTTNRDAVWPKKVEEEGND